MMIGPVMRRFLYISRLRPLLSATQQNYHRLFRPRVNTPDNRDRSRFATPTLHPDRIGGRQSFRWLLDRSDAGW